MTSSSSVVQPGRHRISRIAAAILMGSILLRVFLLVTAWDDLRHGSSPVYASAAIGLRSGAGLTINGQEMASFLSLPDNITDNYMRLRSPGAREPLTEFLPGPAVLLAGLWAIIPEYNYLPLLILQVLLDSLAITALFIVLASRCDLPLSLTVAVFAGLNLAAIRRTLMVGYDFWPQFGVMLLFVGILWAHWHRKRGPVYGLLGLATGLLLWFREIGLALSFFAAAFLVMRRGREPGRGARVGLGRAVWLLMPVLLSLAALSLYRLETTGSPRPTRSTFWHTFCAGIGQFSNPYGLKNHDLSVWEFGKRHAPELTGDVPGEMYRLPNSPYERVLRSKAYEFIKKHPWLFLRNVFYRCGIMISPLLYTEGDFLPARAAPLLLPIGFLMIPLWLVGMLYWRKAQADIFLLSALFYLHFMLAFGWFYVNGRVILPFLFVSFIVYWGGLRQVVRFVRGLLGRDNRRGDGHGQARATRP